MSRTYNPNIQNSLYNYFRVSFKLKPSTQGYLRGDCPSCGKKNTFGVNVKRNRSNCFVCGLNLKPVQLIIKFDNRVDTVHQAWNLVKSGDYSDFTSLLEYKNKPSKDYTDTNIALPDHFKLIIFGNNFIAKAARSYLKKRGFNLDYLAERGVGYCAKGELSGYIIIPYFYKGKLIYYNARNFIGDKHFNNPEVEKFGIGKASIIYNMDALNLYRKIDIVESATNALTLGDRAVGLGGKFASAEQTSILIKAPVEYYTLLLDPDAYYESVLLAMKLSMYKNVKLVELPEEKDVNDIGRKATNQLKKDHNYESWGYFRSLKTQYEIRA